MAAFSREVRARAPALLVVFLLGFFALIFGIASALLPAWFVFSVLLVPAVAAVMFVRPEYALTACVALVCGLIHPSLVPRIPVFGGFLAAADAALAMLAIYAVWAFATRGTVADSAPVVGARWLAVALGLFGTSLAIAVILSLSLRGLRPAFVLGETRDLLYLMVLPIAVVILRQPERQARFVISFVVLGCLFSMGQILQGVFNIPVFGAQGMGALETLGREDAGTTRAITLGLNVIVFSLLLTVGAYVLGTIRKRLFFPVAGLLLVGIVLTFGRTTFAVVLICLVTVVWWLNFAKLPLLASLLVASVAIGSAGAMYLKPDSVAAVYYRMTTIGEEIGYGYSAQWRFWEVEAMLPHIKEHPFVGIGLGADYKGLSGSSARADLNQYMHNAYLYMAGKMGLPALAFFLLSMAAILAIGRRTAKSDAPSWNRIVGAAGAAMIIRFLLASVTEPHLMSDYGVVVIAITGALVFLSAQRSAADGQLGHASQAVRRNAAKQPFSTKERVRSMSVLAEPNQ
jgi:hypothetical protein